MKSLKIDTDMDTKRELLWCFFWANRKAIRTEGCAPFMIERIVSGGTTYISEPNKILKLTDTILGQVEKDMKGEKNVQFTIRIGNETFDLAFHHNVFSVIAYKNKEIETEIIESLHEELIRGKPNFCSSFLKRIGIDMHV
jgi:hypothetical protein